MLREQNLTVTTNANDRTLVILSTDGKVRGGGVIEVSCLFYGADAATAVDVVI